MTAIAVLLAVAAACCYGVAAWMQQGAVRGVARGGRLRLAIWAELVRAPRWAGGLALTAAGATLHACALSLAPLVLVQPAEVLAIPLTAVLTARSAGSRLGGSTRLAVGTCMLGVALVMVIAAGSPAAASVDSAAELRAIMVVGVLVTILGGLGAMRSGRTRCLAFSAAAAVAYGLSSVLFHSIALQVTTGGIGRVPLASVAGLAAALLVGGWFVQHAYASGPPHVVLACQTVIDPMLGIGIGTALLGEGIRITPWTGAGLAASATVSIASVIALSRQPTAPRRTPPTHFVPPRLRRTTR